MVSILVLQYSRFFTEISDHNEFVLSELTVLEIERINDLQILSRLNFSKRTFDLSRDKVIILLDMLKHICISIVID